ncbi:hypothetical protein SAMN02910276_01236 [Butyrivibrio sp. Su6]|uniref:hypothetical protein n=1 Tax=Butyrivibrio sp. Su6 TaxID=1520810 RepID=UPI00089E8DD4|nr:hypothetical protein [Butyrivibrio sp. Su6]SEF85599.1 hypothetical protein SAMN02910276_01236 [Butyrivibrio sp. Su6]
MQFSDIDNGKTFDWGNTSKDYAKYRDIYPDEFYQFILGLGLCKDGQKVLDIGTGTGVLPRNMHRYGAKWIGTDIPFTRECWHGRMRACRGVGAAMDETQLHAWNEDHMQMLNESAPEVFNVKHYVSVAELQVKSKHKIH